MRETSPSARSLAHVRAGTFLRSMPGNGIDVPDEWEPIPFDEEPAYWDDLPEVAS